MSFVHIGAGRCESHVLSRKVHIHRAVEGPREGYAVDGQPVVAEVVDLHPEGRKQMAEDELKVAFGAVAVVEDGQHGVRCFHVIQFRADVPVRERHGVPEGRCAEVIR